jgi:hypothetical protein
MDNVFDGLGSAPGRENGPWRRLTAVPDSGSVHDFFQFPLPHVLSPLPFLFLSLHPFTLLLGALAKYLNGLGEFIAHAVAPRSLGARGFPAASLTGH